ncbi:MAG: ABC transporter permease, partial [Clostridia bacterium]|nr:ABC transporter permease [Clostridia bacterium]
MKNMILMLSRIGSYFRKNKLIFLLFVLGGILNSFVLACFFGEAQELIRMVAAPEDSSYYREYSIQWQPLGTNLTSTTSEAYLGFPNTIGEAVDGVSISNPIEGFGGRKLTLKQAKALSESDLIEMVSVKYVSRENNSHRNAFAMGENVFTVQALIKGNTPLAGGVNYHQVREPLEFARGNAKYKELKDDEIILDLSHSAKVGDTVTVSGVDFRVVAVASNLPGENNLITARAMEKICGGMLDRIGAVSKEQYNETDNPVTRLFHSIFADYGIAYLDIPYPVPTEIQNSYFLSRPERENVVE